MAMYYYASKLSAIACGTRCKQAVLQKNRGQRDRDKDRRRMHSRHHADVNTIGDIGNDTDDLDCDLQVSKSLFIIFSLYKNKKNNFPLYYTNIYRILSKFRHAICIYPRINSR